jgi:hypothetical protein
MGSDALSRNPTRHMANQGALILKLALCGYSVWLEVPKATTLHGFSPVLESRETAIGRGVCGRAPRLAPPAGLEPTTNGLEGRCSVH